MAALWQSTHSEAIYGSTASNGIQLPATACPCSLLDQAVPAQMTKIILILL